MNQEQSIVVTSLINLVVSSKNRFADYVTENKLFEHLTREEAEFMNEVALACQKLADTNTIRPLTNQEKEELH